MENAKATNRQTGIKYNMKRFNRQNYNITSLKKDIETVLRETYIIPSKDEIERYETCLEEQIKSIAKDIPKPIFHGNELKRKCKELCERKVLATEKVQELLSDAILEDWVRKGLKLNEMRERCAFCGQPITASRWDILRKHFDVETEKLINNLKTFIDEVDLEKKNVDAAFIPDSNQFYSQFLLELKQITEKYDLYKKAYFDCLDALKAMAQKRMDNILTEIPFTCNIDVPICDQLFEMYIDLKERSDSYRNQIQNTKANAQEQLRLYEVKSFVDHINYPSKILSISELERDAQERANDLDRISRSILTLESSIREKKLLLNDEEKGAEKVNRYLRACWGANHLSLCAVTSEGTTKCHFEVLRNGQRAFHLSEGECSLIAFCYFIAKLSDTETIDKKPIVWIDDPISSLDANHIYFTYSLITKEILNKRAYSQLFITTHNLQFLKYLRWLDVGKQNCKDKDNEKDKSPVRGNFVIERNGDISFIKPMPKYLRDHGTEFNHWFENIYLCATQEPSDNNLHFFESFGNVSRRFLETYLFYKYPDNKDFDSHLKRYFGDNSIPPLLVRKIADEQSHASGDLENHELAFDLPEIINSAKMILERLQRIDADQYNSLVSSVNQSLETT